jgi:hypothetical protein
MTSLGASVFRGSAALCLMAVCLGARGGVGGPEGGELQRTVERAMAAAPARQWLSRPVRGGCLRITGWRWRPARWRRRARPSSPSPWRRCSSQESSRPMRLSCAGGACGWPVRSSTALTLRLRSRSTPSRRWRIPATTSSPTSDACGTGGAGRSFRRAGLEVERLGGRRSHRHGAGPVGREATQLEALGHAGIETTHWRYWPPIANSLCVGRRRAAAARWRRCLPGSKRRLSTEPAS